MRAEFDPQPFHLDQDSAEAALTGGLIASGWHVAGLFMRLMADSMLLDSTSMGSPGIDTLKWLKPVRPGDTIAARSTVTGARASQSRPGMGIVRFRHEVNRPERRDGDGDGKPDPVRTAIMSLAFDAIAIRPAPRLRRV